MIWLFVRKGRGAPARAREVQKLFHASSPGNPFVFGHCCHVPAKGKNRPLKIS